MDINQAKNQWARGPRDRPVEPSETAMRQGIAVERCRQRRASRDEDSDEEKTVVSMNRTQALE